MVAGPGKTGARHTGSECDMTDDGDKAAFLAAVRDSAVAASLVRIVLSKYRGPDDAGRCEISPVLVKGQRRLRAVRRIGRQDMTETLSGDEVLERLGRWIGGDYLSALLVTQEEEIALIYSRKRKPHLARQSIAAAPPSLEHNRAKSYLVDPSEPWLEPLGITHRAGPGRAGQPRAVEVRPSMYGKFRQICRFVEILDQLVAASGLAAGPAPRVVEIGSGKGYLSFALHAHLAKRRGSPPHTVGIEAEARLVEHCRTVARDCGMAGLAFEATLAEHWSGADGSMAVDILIALHACDTATDDAIHLGIRSAAHLIVTAPCCQHEVAPQLTARDSPLEGMLKFGLLRQRQADLVTDAARALLLEASGYQVRVIEFVSTEHSAKNLMIAAVRSPAVDREAALAQLRSLRGLFGVGRLRLAELLDLAAGAPGGDRSPAAADADAISSP